MVGGGPKDGSGGGRGRAARRCPNPNLYPLRRLAVSAAAAPAASDLSRGPVLVGDLYPGVASSNPAGLTVVGDALFFVANGPPPTASGDLVSFGLSPSLATRVALPLQAARRELWIFRQKMTNPVPLTFFDKNFTYDENGQGYTLPAELTACGPDIGWGAGIVPPPRNSAGDAGWPMGNASDALYFTAAKGSGVRTLWRAAPAPPRAGGAGAAGEWLVEPLPHPSASTPAGLGCIRGVLLFHALALAGPSGGRGPWALDTASGRVVALGDLAGGNGESFASTADVPGWTALPDSRGGASVFFAAQTDDVGVELFSLENWLPRAWPPPTVTLYCDVYPGSRGSLPSDFIVYSGALWFAATLPGVGRELAVLDTVARRVTLAANLDSLGDVIGLGPTTSPAAFAAAVALRDVAAAAALAADATADGSSNPTALSVFDGRLLFSADDGAGGRGRELWALQAAPGLSSMTRDPASACAGRSGAWVALSAEACAYRLMAADSAVGDSFGAAVSVDRGTRFGSAGGFDVAYARARVLGQAWVGVGVGEGEGVGQEDDDSVWTRLSSRGGGGATLSAGGAGGAVGLEDGDAFGSAPPGQRFSDGVMLGRPSTGTILVGAPGMGGGAGGAYIFQVKTTTTGGVPGAGGDGDGWTQAAKLIDSAGVSGDVAGTAVAIDDGLAVVGVPFAAGLTGPTPTGPRTLIEHGKVMTWRRARLPLPSGMYQWNVNPGVSLPTAPLALPASSHLGASVAVFGNVIVAGAPGANADVGTAALWVWTPSGGWGIPRLLAPSDSGGAPLSVLSANYGCAVAASFGIVVVASCGTAAGGGGLF